MYDGNNLLQEKDDIGWVEAEFTYVPQPYAQLVSQRREGESLFHHFDGLRDTRKLSDAAGVVTDEYQYDAWGELKSSTGSTANSHTFKGELLAYRNDPQAGPEQSIYSLHYRDYVASQGRLRSEDPAQDDLNLYRYCHNDPVNRSDPSGLLDLEYTRADKYGQMIVRANEMIVGIRNLKTSSITRTIKVGRTSRNYTVRSTVFSRFVNQIADEQTLEQWTPEDWDNWFRQHDLSVNPAASDYSKAVDLPPRPRYTEPKPTKFDKNSGDLSRYDELVTEANTGDATGDLSQRSGLMPGFMPTATSNGKATQLTMFPIAEAIAELIQLVAIPGEMVSPGGGRQASGAIRSARRSASVTASALDDPTRLAARQVTGDFLDKLEAQLTRRGIRFSRNGRSALKGGKPLADNVGAAVMFDPVQSQMELVLRDDARAFEVIEELIHINDILSLPPQFRKLWGQIPEHRKELSAIYQIMSTPEIWDRLQYAEKIYFIGRLKKYLAIAVKKGEAMGTAVQNIYDPFAGYRTPITRLQ